MAKLEKRERNLLIVLGIIVLAGAIDFAINTDDYLKYYGSTDKKVEVKTEKKIQTNQIIDDQNKFTKYETWGRDPFYDPSTMVKRTVYKPKVQEVILDLKAISFSEGKSVAMINSQIVTVGDVVEGYTVKSIEPKQVIIEKDGQTKTLKLQ